MANPFVHVEPNSTDLEAARAFYTALFDWKLQDMPLPDGPGTYTTIDVGEGTGGGMMAQMIPGAGSAWMPYVLVEDIRAGTDKAASLGAQVLKDVTEVPGMGWLSIIRDPTGALLGFWKPMAR